MVEIRIGDGDVEVLSWEEFEERVVSGRIPDHALVRFEPVTGADFVEASELDLVQSLKQDAARAWQARFSGGGAPILTALLVGVQIRIWIYTHMPDGGDAFTYAFLNWLPPAMEDGEMWRILGSGLLHTDFLHILLNMVWLGYTGWNIERALGRVNLATIFFLSVVGGGLLSMFLTPGTPSLGASGGVYGLVSASVVFGLVRQELLPERGRRLFGFALLPYLLLMFWGGLQNETTDNWAHFGGLVCGGALAFVLDPPDFQRRPRQNAVVQALGVGLATVLLVGLGVFGPSLYPLVDKERARLASLPPAARARVVDLPADALTELTWSVPAGWKPAANLSRDGAFRSPPTDTRRSFAVVQIDDDRPLTPDALVERWESSVRAALDDPEIEHLPSEGPWMGVPAEQVRRVRVRADTPKNGRMQLDMVGTTRGVYGFYRVIEREEASVGRLAPLFARLDATIDWREPLALQAARRDVAANPGSVRTRTSLGAELARWGDAEAALAIQEALALERPDDADRWVAWLRTAGWYPEHASVDAVAERALAALPVPRVVVQLADTLRQRGDEVTADGLLGLAWVHSPGDRELRRALRKGFLPTALASNGLPGELALLPDGTPRPREELERWAVTPLSLESARAYGAQARAEREALAARLPEALADGSALALLLRVRDGAVDAEPGAERGLERDLVGLLDGEVPPWLPESGRAALQERGVVQSLLAEITSDPESDTLPPQED